MRKKEEFIRQLQLYRKKDPVTKTQNKTCKPPAIYDQQPTFLRANQQRIRQYKSKSLELPRDDKRWNDRIKDYISTKQKMVESIDRNRKTSYSFDELPLSRKYLTAKNRLLESMNLKHYEEKNLFKDTSAERIKKTAFVSHLVPIQAEEKPKLRCDSLMVSYVGNYFRRKMSKRHRAFAPKRIKTDFEEMVCFEGSVIDQNV